METIEDRIANEELRCSLAASRHLREVEAKLAETRIAELKAEVARLRERAERAERERVALVEACLTQYSNGRWGAFLGNYALGAFDSRDAAIREIFGCVGLAAAPAGEGPPP
jgi:hypothetical protein